MHAKRDHEVWALQEAGGDPHFIATAVLAALSGSVGVKVHFCVDEDESKQIYDVGELYEAQAAEFSANRLRCPVSLR